jgi:hypothetical protein
MKRLGMTDPRISGFELSERVALSSIAGQARPAVVCNTSIEQIANATGLAHGVVRSALREAEAGGLLTIAPPGHINLRSPMIGLIIEFASPEACAALRLG